MAANYDRTAWFYEGLSKLIFGQAQIRAQEYHLKHISRGSHVLVIGGGTGQILESLTRWHSSGLQITYVEASAKMMALSRKRNVGSNKIFYVTAHIGEVILEHDFNIVITAFLFDNFSDQELIKTFPLIDAKVKPGGLWLNTDFQLTGPLWQKLMLKSMYSFFKLLKAVQVSQLPDVGKIFDRYGYLLNDKKTFYGNFICTAVYRKQPDV